MTWSDTGKRKRYNGTVCRIETEAGRVCIISDNDDKTERFTDSSKNRTFKRIRSLEKTEEKKRKIAMVQVGARLSIHFTGSDQYYSGTVKKVNRSLYLPFFVEFDDGDEIRVDLFRHSFIRID